MNTLEKELAEVEEEVKERLQGNGHQEGPTPLHPRIQWFYRKWVRVYDKYISIKSLPGEDDTRYNI